MEPRDTELARSIAMRFRTAPGEPNEVQLERIKADLLEITRSGRIPSEEDWEAIVSEHCPSAGMYKYAGLDSSDLKAMLQLATKKDEENDN